MKSPRVAYFTDTFHEVNGVALTSRQYMDFARRRGLPVMSVRPAHSSSRDASGESDFELRHSLLSLGIESDLRFDGGFLRHRAQLRAALDSFRPDIIHITSPGHIGILGAMLAHERRIPLAAAWHTNLHEFGARRLERALRFLPGPLRRKTAAGFEREALRATLRFYQLARVTFAPNPELVDLLRTRTGRPSFLMTRGVDGRLFSPFRRRRTDGDFVIGFVGRLTPEKNVRVLCALEREMIAAGISGYRFLVIGRGSEQDYLRAHLRRAEIPGVRTGIELAESYASMDLFLFPSRTDTFGNVVLEAAASGVPAVVMADGGPKFLVEHGVSGLVASSERELIESVLRLHGDRALLERLREGALDKARARSWDAVFESVFHHYTECLR